jgi:hypothetical protein
VIKYKMHIDIIIIIIIIISSSSSSSAYGGRERGAQGVGGET